MNQLFASISVTSVIQMLVVKKSYQTAIPLLSEALHIFWGQVVRPDFAIIYVVKRSDIAIVDVR